jgi:predicted HTH domain antitoxin
MAVLIPDETLMAAGMTEQELKQELAILLYQQQRLTLAQAARLAGMDRLQLQHLLASRGVSINYDIEDLDQDVANLRQLGRL